MWPDTGPLPPHVGHTKSSQLLSQQPRFAHTWHRAKPSARQLGQPRYSLEVWKLPENVSPPDDGRVQPGRCRDTPRKTQLSPFQTSRPTPGWRVLLQVRLTKMTRSLIGNYTFTGAGERPGGRGEGVSSFLGPACAPSIFDFPPAAWH